MAPGNNNCPWSSNTTRDAFLPSSLQIISAQDESAAFLVDLVKDMYTPPKNPAFKQVSRERRSSRTSDGDRCHQQLKLGHNTRRCLEEADVVRAAGAGWQRLCGGRFLPSAAFFKAAAAGVEPHGAHGVRHVPCKGQTEVHVWLNTAVLLPTLPCSLSDNRILRVSF